MTNGKDTVRFDKDGFAEFETEFEILLDNSHIGSGNHNLHVNAANKQLHDALKADARLVRQLNLSPADMAELPTSTRAPQGRPRSFPVTYGWNVQVGRLVNVFNTLLAMTRDEESESYSVQHCHELLRPLVPAGIYPFGDTPGGEYLCFDYRDSPEQPRIVLVSVEAHLYPVANSFRDFLDGLYETEV